MQVFNLYLYTIETHADAFAIYEQVFVWYEARASFSGSYEGAWGGVEKNDFRTNMCPALIHGRFLIMPNL
jgi:hypothetical protein